jgi:hypothetical protein
LWRKSIMGWQDMTGFGGFQTVITDVYIILLNHDSIKK